MFMTTKEIKVVLVDDHEIFREGISLLLSNHGTIDLVAALPNARSLFSLMDKEVDVDVFLLDINLPQMSGIEIARKIQHLAPGSKIIFLTSNTAKMFMESGLKAGAKGFLNKDCSTEELIEGIEQVYIGSYYFGKGMKQSVYENYISNLQVDPTLTELTEREIEVLRCFANGMSYRDISEELVISQKTVETHKYSIFKKLKFKNNAELVKYAIKHHIIEI